MASSAIGIIPVAHAQSINRYLAALQGEDILNSVSLSRLLNSDGVPDDSDPSGLRGATHHLGAWSNVSPEWLAIYQHLSENLPEPTGGFPVMVDDVAVLTEQQAQDAADVFVLSVLTVPGEWNANVAQQNMQAVSETLGIQFITDPDL